MKTDQFNDWASKKKDYKTIDSLSSLFEFQSCIREVNLLLLLLLFTTALVKQFYTSLNGLNGLSDGLKEAAKIPENVH